MIEQQHYLQTGIQIAKKAGKTFVANFGKPKTVSKKYHNYRNLVTNVDQSLEKFIKKELLQKFPQHNVLGEESGWSGASLDGHTWIVDPIDGTTNYIQGLPLCCISIALWDKSGPQIGIVYSPMLNLLFTSARGQGAFLNGKRIHVSNTSRLHDAVGAFGWIDPRDGIKLYPKLVKASRKLRVLASSVLTTAWVGSASLDFYAVPKTLIWDFAAGAAIVLEAGGKITDFRGNPFNLKSTSAVISNGKIHQQLLKILH